jgi:alpha-glucosidase
VWTGDNVSSDEHLLLGCRMLASMGLAGLSFTGMDTGGFSGEPEQSSELFARWCSIGAFTPFFRIHAARNTRAQEPWAFGEWAEETALHYTRLRYRLLPYIYSVFYESTQDGVPVMRAMAVHYPYDELVYDPRFENQFFLGPYILVAPVARSQQFAEVYLPSEGYYDLVTGEFYVDRGPTIVESPNRSEISKLPVFVKAGGILPMQPVVNHTGEKPDTLIVHVFYGEENTRFMFYCDDGVSFKYREGDYHRRMIRWSPSQMSVILEEAEGKYVPGYKMLVVVMHGFPGGVTGVRVNGRHADFKQEGSEIRTPTDYLKGKIILNLQ